VYNDTAYVAFRVDSVGDNELYQTVVARYGDDDCGAGASEAAAWKHPTTPKTWCSMFYVGDVSNNRFYWRGKATLCDSTILGSCIVRSTRPAQKKPDWWEDPMSRKKK